MTHSVLGIDVAKATLDVALIQGERKLYQQFDNTPSGYQQLTLWLSKQGASQASVCLEATGQYGEGVAEYLFAQGYTVSVVNPARIKHYASSKLRRNKTDKADAQLIAEYCLREKPALWSPPPASFKHLQALIRHLEDLQASRVQTTNRLTSGVDTPLVLEQLNALRTFLEGQIRQTKQAIQTLIDATPNLQQAQALLVTIPGIGRLTAAKLLGEIRDICDFQSARQLAAYAGLTPRAFVSGTSVHKKSRLSKTGNANLRKALYMPGISAKRWNPIIHQACERLAQSGLRPQELVCAAMRKLLHQAYGVLKTGRHYDPNYLVKVQAIS
ncbi:MAG: IS110 family transposase [Acidobacteriia bacterium]|nr:IS110 family transposase [Terriglobia bacterium]